MNEITVTNIQRFCVNDGPGIRTTVFLKGCSIRCPWCANPENLERREQNYFDYKKCISKDGNCILNPECIMLKNPDALYHEKVSDELVRCRVHAIDRYGTRYTAQELVDELMKDIGYWKDNGGVTFSGGEAMLQMSSLEPALKMLKSQGVHLAVETCLYADPLQVKIASEYIDFFYVDMKILEPVMCKKVLHGDVSLYLSNLEFLYRTGKKLVLRIPCNTYTMSKDNTELIKEQLLQYSNLEIEIFEMHYLAQSKYESIGQKLWKDTREVKREMQNFLEWMHENAMNARIIKI